MKNLLAILLVGILMIGVVYADEVDERTLEERVTALEEDKLSGCEMTFKNWGTFINQCPRGTFATRVYVIHNSAVQLDCGYYQLKCQR